MDELLSNELGYNVQKFTGLDNIRSGNPNFNALESMRVYAAAIGASYAPLQLLSPELLKGEKESSLVVPVAVFLACVATAATLFVVGSVGLNNAKKRNTELKEDIKRNEYVEKVKAAYAQATDEENGTYPKIMRNLQAYKTNNNRLIAKFISEMEQKQPTKMNTLLFTADAEKGVDIEVVCASKKDAALAFQQLRSFESISVISSSEFEEEYGLRPEYDALLEQLMAKELAELELELMEQADNHGLVADENGNLVPVQVLIDARKEQLLAEKKDSKIALGRIITALETDEEKNDKEKDITDQIDASQFFYTSVFFTIHCDYNTACDTEDFYKGVSSAFESEAKAREQAWADLEKKRKEEEDAAAAAAAAQNN
jgi:hypothetical protein